MSEPMPPYVTVEDAHALLEWHMKEGRRKNKLSIDRRGLGFLTPRVERIGLALPAEEETHDDSHVYLRASF